MTSTLPSGEGTPGGADAALDPDSAPTTGLEPDTAPDAAGELDTGSDAGGPATDAVPTEGAVDGGSGSDDEPERPVLGDPALDNEQELQEARADLQSSHEKSSTARDISDRLTAATRPETARGERS